jgi:hypothetical protein
MSRYYSLAYIREVRGNLSPRLKNNFESCELSGHKRGSYLNGNINTDETLV